MAHDKVLSKVPAVTLGFWFIKILATTLGETGGDFFDKPASEGGLGVSHPLATAIIAAVMPVAILLIPQRAGEHRGTETPA